MKNPTFIAVALLSATSALAQTQPAATAQSAPGVAKPNGIKIGDGRLHPYLTVRAAYDSAVALLPAGGVAGAPNALQGDLVITPSAGLIFNMDTGNTMVNFNGGAGYTWYTGLVTRGTTPLSFVSANVGLDTAFNRQGAVEIQVGDSFSRSNRSGNVAAGIGILSLFNSARAAAPIHPGGGAITITPAVRWDVEFFSPQLQTGRPTDCMANDITCDPALLSRMNYNNLNFALGGKWKFLPKTAVVADVTFDYRTYFNTTPDPSGMVNSNTNLNAQLFRGTVGLSGLITSRISALALVGGGYDFGGSRNGTFLAQAEVAYLGQDITARAGYLRTLSPVPVFGVFGQDRVYAEVRATLFGRLGLRGFGSYDYIQYSQSSRRDHLVSAIAEVSYQFVSIFSASLMYTLSYRTSSINQSAVQYIRHEPALTLTLSY